MINKPLSDNSISDLSQIIESREARVAILGLGYVGLPLLRAFWDGGHPVMGFDIDTTKIDKIRAGENYLKHLGDDLIRPMVEGDVSRFKITSEVQDLAEADVLIICVPTPLGEHQEPDMTFIESTSETIAGILRPGQLVSLESTTYPGTTREVMLPILEKSGLKAGADFFLAYSPEREDPGRKDYNTQSIPKLVGGLDEETGILATELYSHAVSEAIMVESAEIAESAKLLENIYRAVNIALVNEMKVILDPLGIDVWKVIEAAATKPFGFQAFWPGPGLGGHCIPIDPFYLTWKAKEHGCNTRFIELAGEINTAMPSYVVRKTQDALNDLGKAVKGSCILVLGLAYKADVDDMRESPTFELMERFADLGAQIDYHDPYLPVIGPTREHAKWHGMKSVEWSENNLASYDAVVIATEHTVFDLEQLSHSASLIVDTRNAMAGIQGSAVVVKA
ncbi:nucleotide sugar dehydrogenase [Akkermansiaceae bacterium]|nr:nucleotide sugar dehydrogenase [Akkermansiaceae bacterium]